MTVKERMEYIAEHGKCYEWSSYCKTCPLHVKCSTMIPEVTQSGWIGINKRLGDKMKQVAKEYLIDMMLEEEGYNEEKDNKEQS